MKRKLKNSSGFSLVEMLCATAVLMLLCVMLNSGLSVTMKTYFDLTAEAETQLLLNSLTNAVAGELRYAFEVSGGGDANRLRTTTVSIWIGPVGRFSSRAGTTATRSFCPRKKREPTGAALIKMESIRWRTWRLPTTGIPPALH